LLNKIFITLFIFFSLSSISVGNEPTDIWNLGNQENKEDNDSKKEKLDTETNSETFQKTNSTSGQSSLVLENDLKKENSLVVGIYDPQENGLNLNMWKNSDGKKIYDLKKKLIQ